MTLNVIDWQKADEAIDHMEDGAAKVFAQSIMPAFKATVQTITDHIQDRFDYSLGNALSDVTVERTEAIQQVETALHGVLDRLNIPQLVNPRKGTI